ncbi:hypothetical protein CPB85DRAFT_1226543, partial [Mucidula mucida]
HTFEELGELKALSITVNALAACGDITITTALVCLLAQSRPRFANSRRMIKMLIIYSINTGLITTLCAIASLVSILAWGHTFIYITFFFCIGRLYSNSLLATLNARKRIRASGEGVNTTSDNQGMGFSLKDISSQSKPGTLGTKTSHPTNISIKIDTTKEFATDDGGMANNEKDNDDVCSSLLRMYLSLTTRMIVRLEQRQSHVPRNDSRDDRLQGSRLGESSLQSFISME